MAPLDGYPKTHNSKPGRDTYKDRKQQKKTIFSESEAARAACHAWIRASSIDLSTSTRTDAIQEKIWVDTAQGTGRPFEVQVRPADLLVLLDYLRQRCPRARYD